ncbi:MAG: T9SS type A sorting domain-containing protein [Saprospiraceae bacterium]
MRLKLYLALILLGGTLSMFAQITVTTETFPQSGDTLFIKTDNLPSEIVIGTEGPAQDWNFTSLEAPFIRQTAIRRASEGMFFNDFANAELLAEVETGEGYFNVSDSEYALLGYGGQDPLELGLETVARFSNPYVQQRSPMNYEDENTFTTSILIPFAGDDLPEAILDQIPITPDSIRINYAIERTDKVDAWGTVTIPGGIYDVLREKRVEKRNVKVEAKISILDWQDITAFLPQNDLLGEQVVTAYYFFSNESIEPIAIVNMAADEETITSVDFKSEDLVPTAVQDNNNKEPNIYVSPNPAITSTRFEFTNLKAGQYDLKIYNILGVEVWSKEYFISGSRAEKVDLIGFKKGTYLYSLIDSRGKSLATKRLMIVRP